MKKIDFLSTGEEVDIIGNFQTPHLSSIGENILAQKKITRLILSKSVDEILLINSNGFSSEAVLAGLSEKHIEHIAKNAPREYKDNILKTLRNQESIRTVFEIAKTLDDSQSTETTQNQDRIRNVIQYIKDNLSAFEF